MAPLSRYPLQERQVIPVTRAPLPPVRDVVAPPVGAFRHDRAPIKATGQGRRLLAPNSSRHLPLRLRPVAFPFAIGPMRLWRRVGLVEVFPP